MSNISKAKIIKYIAGMSQKKDLSEAEALMAAKIMAERRKNSSFILPKELNWTKSSVYNGSEF